ncbi:MAG: universal stress protein [Acidithiobacillales bacterium]
MKARRILVALDGSRESRAALAAAARLGIATGAGLIGLFVEDVELLRLAGLPFAREAGLSSGVFRRLDISGIELRFRVAAERAREALREVAESSGLASSFRVVRGRVVPELLAAALEADVVAAGKRSVPGPPGRRLGGTLRSLIARVPAPILVGGLHGFFAGPVVVVSPAAAVPEEALRFVALLAQAFGTPEVVVIARAGGVGPPHVAPGIRLRRRGVPSASSGGLGMLPEIADASAVILVRPEGGVGPELLVEIAEAVTCPVFIVGPLGLAELLSA